MLLPLQQRHDLLQRPDELRERRDSKAVQLRPTYSGASEALEHIW
jgi:hypothetical protein